MLLDIYDMFPNLLKSGFIGLVAIFAILLYFLFKNQFSSNLSTKEFLAKILPFIIVTILLLAVSGYSIYTNNNIGNKTVIDSLTNQINYYKGLTPENETLQQRSERLKAKNDSIKSIVSKLIEDSIAFSKTFNSEALDIANVFEKSEIIYNEKNKDWIYNGVKNTVFQNLYSFRGDSSLLRLVLQIISSRGLKFDIDKVVKELPGLIVLRRSFLKKIIPQLNQGIEESLNSQVQARFQMEFQLPKEVWITKEPYYVYYNEESTDLLAKEKKLLEQLIK